MAKIPNYVFNVYNYDGSELIESGVNSNGPNYAYEVRADGLYNLSSGFLNVSIPNLVGLATEPNGKIVYNVGDIIWNGTTGNLYAKQTTPSTDTKPVYKRVNGEWVKQDAFQRISGAWVRISSKEEVTKFVQIFPTKTSDNLTLINNLNQSKIYTIGYLEAPNSFIISASLRYANNTWTITGPWKIYSQTANSIKIHQNNGYFENWTSMITVEGDSEADIIDFYGLSPTEVYAVWRCFIEGTQITLSDGSTKPVQDIQYIDELLVWDFDNACLTSAKPLWIMKEHKATKYNHLVFSDGSTLDTVNQHRIFNLEKGMFTYPMTDDTPIGTTTVNDKGEYITLVSKEVIEKEVNYYNIITDYHINLFAGSILTSCRLSNLYPIKDMKYIKDDRNIIPYEEFNNIPVEYYYGLRLGEQPTDINRDSAVSFGDTSVEDYVKRLINMKKE